MNSTFTKKLETLFSFMNESQSKLRIISDFKNDNDYKFEDL